MATLLKISRFKLMLVETCPPKHRIAGLSNCRSVDGIISAWKPESFCFSSSILPQLKIKLYSGVVWTAGRSGKRVGRQRENTYESAHAGVTVQKGFEDCFYPAQTLGKDAF